MRLLPKQMKNFWKNISKVKISPKKRLLTVFVRATLNVDIAPVVCGSSFKNKGIQFLLNAVINFLPSPLDVPAIKGVNPETSNEEERHSVMTSLFRR